jgi:diguanylate cyclase (GGDEF)-like protein
MLLAKIFHPHDPTLVVLSVMLAILASFVSLELAGRIKAAGGRVRFAWLAAAGIAMGGGIWSMHFVAMIGHELPFAVAYSVPLTALSLLIAIVVSTVGLYTVFWSRPSAHKFVLGGSLMGLGIATMHYTGMAALILPVATHYNYSLVALSVGIAIAASMTALFLAFNVERLWQKCLSALLMGTAVSAMHFTGMAALVCGPVLGATTLPPPGGASMALVAAVAGTSGAILVMGLSLAAYDRHIRRLTWTAFIANESERRINALLRNAADLIAIVDYGWNVTYLSSAIDRHATWAGGLAVGADFLSLLAPEARDQAVALLDSAVNHPGQPVRQEIQGAGGSPREWFEITLNNQYADLAIHGIIVNLKNITAPKQATALIEQALARANEKTRLAEQQTLALEQQQQKTRAAEEYAQELEKAHAERRAAEEQARLLARHDSLTGLPNRRVFAADLQVALNRAQSGAAAYSLLLIDLDEFQRINELHGHQAGDTVLCEVARRIESVMRKSDMAARLGGDEFAIIAEGETELSEHLEEAKLLAGRLLGAIRQPMLADELRVEIDASIGIVSCRAEATDIGSLLRAADIAMHRAKDSGGSTFRFFEQSMDDELRARKTLEQDLIRAVETETIQPYYQPLVDINLQRIRGFEALARWQHPERGFVPPDVFIPIVEQLGLMTDMTASMLRQACRTARQWPEDIRISVNFSPSELQDPALPSRILTILGQEGLNPKRLEVEITESALVSNISTAKTILTTLQSYGITICLDDFGTGYSSLYHLRELKFDKVKIDRSFVQAMQENLDSEKIVDAILGLTQNLNLPTVAEGIETPEVLPFLASKGCEFGQGYYFGKAMAGDHVDDLLRREAELCGS